MNKLGLQMYTVRELLSADTRGTIEKVKKIGYNSIQLAGNLELMEKTAIIAKELDIHVIGIMSNINNCEEKSEKLFEICRICNATDIGIGTGAVTYDEVMEFVEHANSFAETAAKEGITVSYHNHSHEFMKTEAGKTVMQLYSENLKCINFMLDTYWIQHGGADIRKTIEDFKGRVKILHLKDMIRVHEGQTFAPVGSGNLYFEGIIETAKKCGIENFYIEQDICLENPLVCIEKSYNYVKELIK